MHDMAAVDRLYGRAPAGASMTERRLHAIFSSFALAGRAPAMLPLMRGRARSRPGQHADVLLSGMARALQHADIGIFTTR